MNSHPQATSSRAVYKNLGLIPRLLQVRQRLINPNPNIRQGRRCKSPGNRRKTAAWQACKPNHLCDGRPDFNGQDLNSHKTPTKFTASTNYADARSKVLAAAQELYGAGSKEAIAVQRAYAQVAGDSVAPTQGGTIDVTT